MGIWDTYKATENPVTAWNSARGIFSGGTDPSKAAMPYYQQIPDILKKYMQPYIDSGTAASGDLSKQYEELRNDPGSLMARLGKGYTASPGYEFEKTQGLQGINNAAAAGGMLGTAGHQQEAGELETNLANKDYSDYLKQALGLWGQGITGEEGIADKGFESSSGMSKALSDMLESEGNLAYTGQQSRNDARTAWIKALMGGLGGAVGGAATGGPAGAAAGAVKGIKQ